MSTKYLLKTMIKNSKLLFVSIMLIAMMGVAIQIMTGSSYTSLRAGLDKFLDDYRYADITVITANSTAEDEEQLGNIEGVKSVLRQTVFEQNCELKSKSLTVRFFTYETDADLYIYESQESNEYINIALEYSFAKRNGIHAGDIIDVYTRNGWQKMCIGKIVSSPEGLNVQRNEYAVFDEERFCYGFVLKEDAEQIVSNQALTYFRIYTDRAYEADTILDNVLLQIDTNRIIDSYTREASAVKNTIDSHITPMKIFSLVFPSLFYMVALLFIVLFVKNMIYDNQLQIGIFRALGVQIFEIRKAYIIFILFATGTASIIGIGAGNIGTKHVCELYADVMAFRPFEAHVQWKLVLASVILVNAVGFISAWFSTMAVSKIQPANAMRARKLQEEYRKQHAPKSSYINRPFLKMGIMGVFRDKENFCFGVFSMTASIVLLLIASSFFFSKEELISNLLEKRYHYSLQLHFDSPISEPMQQIICEDNNTVIELMAAAEREVEFDNKKETVMLNGIEKDSSMISVFDDMGKQLFVKDKGIILCKKIAEKLGCQKGDYVTIGEHTVQITDISNQETVYIQYCSFEQAEILNIDKQLMVCQTQQDTEGVIKRAEKIPEYTYSVVRKELLEVAKDKYACYQIGVYIISCFTAVMCITVIINLTLFRLLQSMHSFGIMKSLGYSNKSIGMNVLMGQIIQYILAVLIAYPLGITLANALLDQMNKDNIIYPHPSTPFVYISGMLFVFVLLLTGHFIGMRRLSKSNLAELLKEE